MHDEIIAHPNLEKSILQEIENQLLNDEQALVEASERIDLRKIFLASTKIYNILKNQLPNQQLNLDFDYSYDHENHYYNFKKIVGACAGEDISHLAGLKNLKSELLSIIHLLDKGFFDSDQRSFTLMNNDEGRKIFLKAIIVDKYELWQQTYLEQILTNKNNLHKKIKI